MDDGEIAEFFVALGPVTIRRMFSGKGVYIAGVIVAIEFGGELRLKADSVSAPAFAAAGAMQWAYDGHQGVALMPYWSVPDEALDDPDLMAEWVRRAFEAGLGLMRVNRLTHVGGRPKSDRRYGQAIATYRSRSASPTACVGTTAQSNQALE